MSNYSRLSDLAAQIQASTDTVEKYLKDHNLPAPSFHEDGPVDFGLNEEAQKALETAKTSSLELFDLLQGPAYNGVSLQAIYRYDIASKVPINGEISYQDLSAKCGPSVINLQRILRFAMVWNRCCKEPRKGFVAHSATSKVLVDNPMAWSGLGFMFDECWQAFAHMLDAVRDHGDTEDVVKTGWTHYHKTNQGLFQYHSSRSGISRRMAKAMICFSSAVSVSSQASFLVKNYPWDTVAKVVDVGGAQGHVSIELAQKYPNLKVVLQGLPDVVEGIEKTLPKNVKDRIEIMGHDFFTDQPMGGSQGAMCIDLARHYPKRKCISQDLPDVVAGIETPEDLTGRVEIVAHDFFTEQPVKGADAYLFRWIFHDWSDKYSIEILRNLIPTLKHGAKIVIGEVCLPKPGGNTSYWEERRMRGSDFTMKSCLNGRERDADEWAQLFEKADSRFKFQGIAAVPNSRFSVIEAAWEGSSAPGL